MALEIFIAILYFTIGFHSMVSGYIAKHLVIDNNLNDDVPFIPLKYDKLFLSQMVIGFSMFAYAIYSFVIIFTE